MFWRGVIGYLPVNIVQAVVGLLTIVAFTRLLSPAQYGVYALAFSVMSLAHTALFTWLEAAMARFFAAEAKGARLADHFATLYRAWAMLAASFVGLAGAALWIWPLAPALKVAVAAGVVAILARSLLKLAQERRRAGGDVRGAAVIDMVQTAGGFAIGAGLALAGLGGAGPMIGLACAAGVCLIWALPTELKAHAGGRLDAKRARTYAAYGLPISISLGMALVLANTDRFVLAAYRDEITVGVYQAGYSLANRTLDVMFIWLGMAGGPASVAALEQGGLPALRVTAREQASLMVSLTLPAAIGLALVARPLAEVMVGPGLRDGAAQVTPWIAASAFLSGITVYYFHTAFTLARRSHLLMAVMCAPAVLNLVLNLTLVPRFGLSGALWATLASYGLGALASWGLGRGVLALPIPWTALAKAALASVVMAAAVVLVPASGGAPELIAKAAVGVLVYAGCALALDLGDLRGRAGRVIHGLRVKLA
jgi:O-antigen/teichoic acid export membrane protein